MTHTLYNKKNEKILTILSVANETFSTMFQNPNFYGVLFFNQAKGILTLDEHEITISNQDILFYY